jgi:hypothetical protein
VRTLLHAATISAGEWITATGEWVNDRTHGQQFKGRFLRCSAPTSADGIEKYLASGMLRGIGPVYAKKLDTSIYRSLNVFFAGGLARFRCGRPWRGRLWPVAPMFGSVFPVSGAMRAQLSCRARAFA